MPQSWLRKQAGQAVVLVAIAVLVLTAILMLALDGGGIYLDKRQIQNAADAAALTGAEWLMSIPFSYSTMHQQAVNNLVQNLPGTSTAGSVCSPSCPNTKVVGLPGGNGVGTINLGAGYYAELNASTSYTYQVTVWHVHQVAIAPLHGFQSTITLPARATAQNADLPYAIVLLQDKSQYATYSNFNINGTPGSITMQYTGSNPNNRGGMFSNASIAPGNDSPSIIFQPPLGAGNLWAVNESASDASALIGRVSGNSPANPLPGVGSHLDFPNYPEPVPPAATYNGSTVLTGSTTVICPGQYTNQIMVQNGATAILYPGVYQVQANGVSVQGTLRTLQPSDFSGGPFSATCPGLAPITSMPSDPGAIIEVRPGNVSGSTLCNKHIFSAAATSTITLQPSPKYFNISLYIETMPGWQTTCTTMPLGTNVVRFSGGACYSIQGAIYGPADNMVLTGSGCGTGVGQVVAWTMTINGNGNVNETYNPAYLPYMKGLTQ